MRIRRYLNSLLLIFALLIIFFIVLHFFIPIVRPLRDDIVVEVIGEIVTSLIISLALAPIGRWLLRWLRSQLLTPDERRLEEETRSQERVYLNNVLNWLSNGDALGVYTELDAGSVLEPRFVPLLPVMDKSAQSAPRFLAQRKYPEPRRSLMSLIDRHKRLVIKGNPGSGKTFTFKWLAQQFARRALTRHESPLPLLISLREYRGGGEGKPQSFFDFVLGYVREHEPSAPFQDRDSLKLYLSKGRIVLLLDGLNEMPITDYHDYSLRLQEISVFSKKLYPSCRCYVSCRTLHYDPLLDITAVEILDFNENQSLAFLERFLGSKERANYLLHALRLAPPQVLALAYNPLYLTMIAQFFKDSGVLPETTSELLRQIVQKRLEKASSPDLVVKYLRDLAWKMHQAGFFGAQVPKEWIVNNHPSGLDEDVLRVAKEAGLVDVAADGDVSFYHHVFQEYFAALELVRIPSTIRTYIDAPAWEETVVLALRLMAKDEQYLLRFLPTDSEIEGDPSKSADRILLLAKGHRELPEPAAKAVKVALVAQAQKLLEVLTGVQVTDPWLGEEAPSYSTTYVRVTLLSALGLIDNSQAVELIKKTVGIDRSWISELELEVLSSMATPEAIPRLRSALKRELGTVGILTLLRVPEYLPREVKRWLRRQQISLIAQFTITIILALSPGFLCVGRATGRPFIGTVGAMGLVMWIPLTLITMVYLMRLAIKDLVLSVADSSEYQAGPREWIRVLGRRFVRSPYFVLILLFVFLALTYYSPLYEFLPQLSVKGTVYLLYLMANLVATEFYWRLFREAKGALMSISLWIRSWEGRFFIFPIAVMSMIMLNFAVVQVIVLYGGIDWDEFNAEIPINVWVPHFQSAWANLFVLVYFLYHIPAAVLFFTCLVGPSIGAVRVRWIARGLKSSSNGQIAVGWLYRIAVNPWAWPKSRGIALSKLARTPDAIKFLGEHQSELETLAASPYKPVALAAQQALYETSRRLRYSKSVE